MQGNVSNTGTAKAGERGTGMDSYWHPWDLIYLSPVVIGWYIALVFYLLSAQSVLSSPPAEGRTMPPRRVWFAMIPVFGFAWLIVVALSLTESLENELRAKEIRNLYAPRRAFGVAAGCLFCVATVFMALAIVAAATGLSADAEFGYNQVAEFGWVMWFLSGAAGLVLWAVQWAQAERVSSRLLQPWTWNCPRQPHPSAYLWPPPSYAPAASVTGQPAADRAPHGEFCPACGAYAPGARYCPCCGKARRAARSDPPATAGQGNQSAQTEP